MIPYKQLSLAEIFSDCQEIFANDKHAFLTLLEKHIDIDEILPVLKLLLLNTIPNTLIASSNNYTSMDISVMSSNLVLLLTVWALYVIFLFIKSVWSRKS